MSVPLFDRVSKDVLQLLVEYTEARAEVYYKKEILKESPPWTNHEWLQSFKFTNVKRWLDRETKWAINNILNNDSLSWQSKALNVTLFQMINRGDSYMERFHKVLDIYEMSYDDILELARKEIENEPNCKSPLQSNAYFLSSVRKCANDIVQEEIKYTNCSVVWLVKDNTDEILEAWKSDNASDCMDHLRTVPSLGAFLAYQVFATMSYSPETKYTDDDYVSCGPGTCNGSWRLLGKVNPEEGFESFIRWLKINIYELCEYHGLKWDIKSWLHYLPEDQREFTHQDWTNAMCELSKLCKLTYNEPMRYRWYKFPV